MSLHAIRATALRRSLAILGATVLAAGLTTMTGSTASASEVGSDRTPIPGSSPAWTASAQAVGSPASDQSISFEVVLRLRDAAGAEKLAGAVSDPNGANYGKYLSPGQFNARFAPTAAQVATVQSFLTSQGLSVSGVASGNRWINASGTVAQIQKAFAATLRTYNYKGRRLRGTPSALSTPSSVARLIAGVIGVSQTASLAQPNHVIAQGGTPSVDDSTGEGTGPNDAVPPPRRRARPTGTSSSRSAPPAYGKTSFPTNNCGYTAAQLRARVRHPVRGRAPPGRQGRHRGDHRRVRVADDRRPTPTRWPALNGEPQLAAGQYTETDFGPFDLQDECGPSRLERGGDARRRGRARHGAGREHPLRRRAGLRHRHRRRGQLRAAEPHRRHREQLVRRSSARTASATRSPLEHSMFVQAAARGHRLLLLHR